MVCPNTYFAVTKLANKINIPNKGQKEEISFMLTMETGVQYVGVMAVTPTGEEIFYKPIEVGSLWSKWEQNSTGHRFMMVLIILLVFCVLAIWIRRVSRKGYKPLN
jgi:ribose/xylose/arabinose/galactoside ABC-type transport system permease subunit